ncbi:ATP-binding cassette domain-containing protein [Halobaculum sp. CBA1158]|uniref:ABC transporter ATP-binding protein n=1 Tax=Halobaculum sp. CBA1158 TaxID=2904243 RepID=UPI001F37C980|nr:ATP-binding cassette domain-containing protein [Halobaculum sp. CBA1158]UIP00433.1 ATP-binding cassette domain-containing protein [Halobaculum sp. CBA1158]
MSDADGRDGDARGAGVDGDDADRSIGDADRSMDDPDHPMIAVRDLVVSRGGERVLDGVSLSVERGELVGLVGPNGAGKTTLIAACNGTLAAESGSIELDGRDLGGLSRRETARLVATVPQEAATAFEFSVEAVVEMGRTAYVSRFGTTDADDRAAIERAMDRANVARFADRSVTTLSGGERQRVLFARALAAETPGLLLDEPTASLDINHQIRTLELVREVVDDGKAALAAIHDLNLAARVCDRLVLLAGGTVRASGPPREVLGDDALADAFGVATAVNDDPAVGTPMVTALRDGEEARTVAGDPRPTDGDAGGDRDREETATDPDR